MGSLRLYAIAIDEVRDIFCAPEETAAALRAIAADRFAPPRRAVAPGLLGKLGPVFRRPADAPVVRPGVPSGSDVDLVLTGRYVPPHRLGACWTLLEAWVDAMAWSSVGHDFTESALNEFDFDLARAAVPARFGLRALLTTDLRIAMVPAPGLAAGFVTLEHVLAMAAAWRPAIDQLEVANRPVARTLLAWLDTFPGLAERAPEQHREPPDLVAILRV